MLYDVIGEYCDDEAWPQIFMAGEMTNGRNDEGCISSDSLYYNNKYYQVWPFFLSTSSGNPKLVVFDHGTSMFTINVMMARAEDQREDILLYSAYGLDSFLALKRIE